MRLSRTAPAKLARRTRGVAKRVLITSLVLVGLAVGAAVSLGLVTGFLSERNVIPNYAAIPGSALPTSQLDFLRGKGLLGEEERVQWFYSNGMYRYSTDGNYFTETRVVSYWEGEKGFEAETATWAEIVDLRIQYSASPFENTEITVETTDGREFLLWVAAEKGNDKRFVSAIRERWEAGRHSRIVGR